MIAKKPPRQFNLKLFLSTRRYLAIGIAAFLGSFLITFMLAYPQLGAISNLRNKIAPQEKKLLAYEKKVLDLNKVESMPEFQQSAKVDDVLPSKKPLIELLTNLNLIAKKTKISFVKFDVKPGAIATTSAELAQLKSNKSKQGYDAIEVKMTIKGKLKSVNEFINLAERVTPLTTVIDFTLSRIGKIQNIGKQTQTETEEGRELVESQSQKTQNILAEADLVINTYFYTQSVETTLQKPLPEIGQDELQVLALLEELKPSEFEQQIEIISGQQEDLFGIKGLDVEELLEKVEVNEAEVNKAVESELLDSGADMFGGGESNGNKENEESAPPPLKFF